MVPFCIRDSQILNFQYPRQVLAQSPTDTIEDHLDCT